MIARDGRDEGGKADQALARALSEERDSIVPSLGFAESVMAAVQSDGPGPLRFPWTRAIPLLIAGFAALAGFAVAAVWLVERLPESGSPGPAPLWTAMPAMVLRYAASPDTAWILTALLIPLVTLWLTRRLVFGR